MSDLNFYNACQAVQIADDAAGAPITSTVDASKRRLDVDTGVTKIKWEQYDRYLFAATIASSQTQNIDFVVPSGQIWDIEHLLFTYSRQNQNNEIPPIINLIWDPAGANYTIFRGYVSTLDIECKYQITGDGSKILRMRIENQVNQSLRVLATVQYLREA